MASLCLGLIGFKKMKTDSSLPGTPIKYIANYNNINSNERSPKKLTESPANECANCARKTLIAKSFSEILNWTFHPFRSFGIYTYVQHTLSPPKNHDNSNASVSVQLRSGIGADNNNKVNGQFRSNIPYNCFMELVMIRFIPAWRNERERRKKTKF